MSKLSVDLQSTREWQWDKSVKRFRLGFNGSIRVLEGFVLVSGQSGLQAALQGSGRSISSPFA